MFLDQFSHDVDVAPCGLGIRTRLVRAVHQGLGDFALQTRQADVEARLSLAVVASRNLQVVPSPTDT